MNKILTFLFILGTLSLQAQKKDFTWFDAGIKVQTGASGFYNKALSDSDLYDYEIGLTDAFSIGGKLGFNYGNNGLAVDVMFGRAKQRLEVSSLGQTNTNIEWNTLDVYALYRNAKNLGYFEIGPKISFVNKVEKTGAEAQGDIKSAFNGNFISGVIGFGANLIGNDGRFSGILGLRFEYGLTDFVNKDTGLSTGAPVMDPRIYAADGYTSTAPIFAGVVFELNWGIGGFGKAACGQRSKFIFF